MGKLDLRWDMFQLAVAVIEGRTDFESAYNLAKMRNAEDVFKDAYLRVKVHQLGIISAEDIFLKVMTALIIFFGLLGLALF